jgi:hypothetical protein
VVKSESMSKTHWSLMRVLHPFDPSTHHQFCIELPAAPKTPKK